MKRIRSYPLLNESKFKDNIISSQIQRVWIPNPSHPDKTPRIETLTTRVPPMTIDRKMVANALPSPAAAPAQSLICGRHEKIYEIWSLERYLLAAYG